MKNTTNKIMVMKSDYEVMTSYIKGRPGKGNYDVGNANKLLTELNRATIVSGDTIPDEVVRINSKVIVKDETTGRVIELTVVAPEKADIKSGKISFMAPVGIALIGFKEGDKVKWSVPSGDKTFLLLKVSNES